MKTVIIISLISILLFSIFRESPAQQVPVQKRSRIITYKNQITSTYNWVIRKDTLICKSSENQLKMIPVNEIKSISVKKGTTFPYVMGTGIAIGLVKTYTDPNIPQNRKFAGGLIIGAAVGLIVAPFVRQPLTVVYYDGKWKDEKYKPKE